MFSYWEVLGVPGVVGVPGCPRELWLGPRLVLCWAANAGLACMREAMGVKHETGTGTKVDREPLKNDQLR
jgi:hypothetical protein